MIQVNHADRVRVTLVVDEAPISIMLIGRMMQVKQGDQIVASLALPAHPYKHSRLVPSARIELEVGIDLYGGGNDD